MESRKPPGIELMPCPFPAAVSIQFTKWEKFPRQKKKQGKKQQKNGQLGKFYGPPKCVCVSAHFHFHIFSVRLSVRLSLASSSAKLLGPRTNWLWLWGPGPSSHKIKPRLGALGVCVTHNYPSLCGRVPRRRMDY